MPEIALPPPMPYEAWYPPRGLEWPGPVLETPRERAAPETPSLASLERDIARGLEKEHYRDLNNTNNQITFFTWYWNNPAGICMARHINCSGWRSAGNG